MAREAEGKPNSDNQRRRICGACARNVVCNSVRWRSANEWKAKRDVCALSKVERFQWDQCLVMIHAEYRVVARALCFDKKRICGEGPDCVHPSGPKRGYRRANDRLFFCTEHSPFAGMRIQSSHRDTRIRDSKIHLKSIGRYASGVDDGGGTQVLEYLAQCDMHGDWYHAKRVRSEHHHRLRVIFSETRKKLRMAAKVQARSLPYGLLVDGIRYNSRGLGRHGISDRPLYGTNDGACIFRGW